MKKTIFAFFLFLASFLNAQTQDNFSRGYIITSTSDTLKGWIDFRTDQLNAKECKFKPTLDAEEQVFYPEDIIEYRLTDVGKFYVSKTIMLYGAERNVFLEFLLKGMINLYFFQEDFEDYHTSNEYNKYVNYQNPSYYFFENEKGELIPLKKKSTETIREDKNELTKEDNEYKGVFNYLFKDFEPLKEKALNAPFTNRNMIGLAKEYHKLVCTSGEECIEFITRPDKKYIAFSFSAYTGIDFSTFPISFYKYKLSEPIKGVSPMIGGQINFSIPRISKSVSLQLDVSLTKIHTETNALETSYSWVAPPEGYHIENYSQAYDSYRSIVNMGIKYTFPVSRLRPTLEVGFFNETYYNEKEYFRKNFYNSQTSDRIQKDWYIDTKHGTYFSLGLYAAYGLDYQFKNGHSIFFNINNEFSSYMTATQLKLGFTF